MKKVFLVAGSMLLCSLAVSAQLLLVGRGTSSKAALVSELFNVADKQLTHIGVGFFEGRELFIAHVTDEPRPGKSALLIEPAASFWQRPDVRYRYFRVLPGFLQDELLFRRILAGFLRRRIVFDMEFRIDNGPDKLYCSEFCVELINQLADECKQLWPKCLLITDGFVRQFLKREVFHYFPVDIPEAYNLVEPAPFRRPMAGRR